jgi:hypothetical protein
MTAHFTIGKKLTLGVAARTLSVLVLSYASLRAISRLATSSDTAVNQTARELAAIGTTQEAFQELRQELVRQQIGYAMAPLERAAQRTWPCVRTASAARRRSSARLRWRRNAPGSRPLATMATARQSAGVPARRGGPAARCSRANRRGFFARKCIHCGLPKFAVFRTGWRA